MDELIKELRIYANDETDEIRFKAADAIEQLSNAGSAYGRGWTLGYDAGREESKPRWIPVAERLPERFKSVLTVDKYGVITFNWISGDGENWSTGYHITHWMPLPPAPKEE